MMAMALMVSTMTFAGDSEALKAVMKSKVYAEAAQLLKDNLSQMTDNAEKAKAYNHLVDLAMEKVTKEVGTATENQLAAQTGGKVQPYDTIGLANAICDAIENTIECDKYDQLPNAKGKIAPKFVEKNPARVWAVRQHLVNIGQNEVNLGHHDNALKYWGAFVDSAEHPIFASQDHAPEQGYFSQVALFSGRFALEAKDYDRANRYLEVAKRDPKEKSEAITFQLFAMRSNLKTHEDSLNCINKLKEIYEQDPSNEVLVETINGMYEGMKSVKAQRAFLDQHLEKFPNSFTALANKGLMAVNENNAEEGAKWLRKAAEAKPDNALVFTLLGSCLSVQAANTEDTPAGKEKSKELFKQAIEAFDKAKELDPDKRVSKWGYNRYQAYYGLYGENDPRTKAAEEDSKY